MPGPVAAKLVLSEAQRTELVEISRHRSTPRSILLRVGVILGAAEGIPNRVLARKLSTSLPTVLLWRRRYEGGGLPGIVEDRPRSGRPKQISPEQEAAIVNATLKTTPKDATHWSVRAMDHRQKVSPATVHRIWKKHKLQPHRVDSFKFSNDPDFAYKVRDYQIAGAPGWMTSDRFDVNFTPDKTEATPRPGVAPKEIESFISRNQQRMQAVFRDRFGLVLRAETHELHSGHTKEIKLADIRF